MYVLLLILFTIFPSLKTAEMTGSYRGPYHEYTNREGFSSQRLRVIEKAQGRAIRVELGSGFGRSCSDDPLIRYGPIEAYILRQLENFDLHSDEFFKLDLTERTCK